MHVHVLHNRAPMVRHSTKHMLPHKAKYNAGVQTWRASNAPTLKVQLAASHKENAKLLGKVDELQTSVRFFAHDDPHEQVGKARREKRRCKESLRMAAARSAEKSAVIRSQVL